MIGAAALLGGNDPPRSVLMLGLAGGTAFRVLRHLLPNCQLTAIDIDPEIVCLAREHMDLDALGIEVILTDAYPWLEKNRRTFDVVIDDIYLAGKTDVFRPRAWDERLLEHLRRALAPEGVLAVNLVTGAGHRTMQSLTRRVLRGAFPELRSIKSAEAMNEVLVAGAAVASRRRLEPYAGRFKHWRDRTYWDRLEVRRIA
jgi:spermidine synthase